MVKQDEMGRERLAEKEVSIQGEKDAAVIQGRLQLVKGIETGFEKTPSPSERWIPTIPLGVREQACCTNQKKRPRPPNPSFPVPQNLLPKAVHETDILQVLAANNQLQLPQIRQKETHNSIFEGNYHTWGQNISCSEDIQLVQSSS